MISESGYDQHENTMYEVANNNNQFYRQQNQQAKNNFAVSYLNSPQQMSTPINNRVSSLNQFSSIPYNQQQQQQQQQRQPFQQASNQFQTEFQQTANSANTSNKPHQIPIQSECEIHFSGKHDAIYIYLSRLLAPIWDLNLLCELTSNCKQSLQTNENEPLVFATFIDIDLQWFLNRLNELKRFLELNFSHLKTLKYSYLNSSLFGATNNMQSASNIGVNSSGSVGGGGGGSGVGVASPTSANTNQSYSFGTQTKPPILLQQPQQQQQQQQTRFATQFSTMPINLAVLNNLTSSNNNINNISSSVGGGSVNTLPQISEEKLAIEIENGSIYLIKQFLNRIIEIFGLWKILEDHKYHFISSKLDDKTQLTLMKMQIKTFLLADNSLLEKLITALLYRYIDDNACTDLLNQSLKQMCPSLYSNENAIYSKACEKLKQALNAKNDSYERDRLLKEAVDLMKQIGYVANLTQVCEALQTAGCYEAVFELCLTAVEKRDPQNIGLHYYRKSEPPEDIQGQNYFNLRTECYKSILDCLDALIKNGQGISIMQQQQPPPPPNRLVNTKEKAEDQINYLIKYLMNSKDELAHVSLFNWMINNNFEKKLITLDSIFLENFLIREIKDKTKNRIYLDLLWRHYDFKKDYQNAAKVLTALAEKYSESQISLKERVEYLAQAIVALNSTQKVPNKDELAELNDKKDVALLQEKIYIELSKVDPRTDLIQDALIQLDSQLHDITKVCF
jgi:hypothetical protein